MILYIAILPTFVIGLFLYICIGITSIPCERIQIYMFPENYTITVFATAWFIWYRYPDKIDRLQISSVNTNISFVSLLLYTARPCTYTCSSTGRVCLEINFHHTIKSDWWRRWPPNTTVACGWFPPVVGRRINRSNSANQAKRKSSKITNELVWATMAASWSLISRVKSTTIYCYD